MKKLIIAVFLLTSCSRAYDPDDYEPLSIEEKLRNHDEQMMKMSRDLQNANKYWW